MRYLAFGLLVWAWAQVPSIHQLEAAYYRPLNYLSESAWDSLNGYIPPQSAPSFRSTTSCVLTKQVMGYHPYWAGTAFTSYQWNLLSTVVFFSYEVDPATGSYSNPTVVNTWRTTSLVPTAQANGTQVQLCASLFGGTNLANFLTNSVARLRCIDSLISLITLRNAEGINIDFEGLPSSQRTNFTNFMQQLRDTLNRRRPGAKLSVALPAVDWNNAYDVAALSAICDQLFIMGYDYYWSTAPTAGPTGLLYTGTLWGSRCNSRSIIDYLASGAARSKLILGVPYYGFRYPTSSNTIPSSTTGSGISRTYANAKAEANTYGWNWDPRSFSRYFMYQSGGQWYQTWWHDSLSLAWLYRVALMQGIGGVGMWALSYDGSNPELWNALRDHFTDCASVACQDSFYDMNGPEGTYWNRENWTWTLAPSGAAQILVHFTDFALENGYDTLWIYDGPSPSAPLIGYYTGTNSPGTITSSGSSLTFRYKSDNATVARGWRAGWQCVLDNTPPTTSIDPFPSWQAQHFTASFTDQDNQGISGRYVCVADYDGTRWSANPAKGMAYEDFPGTSLPPGWSVLSGNWSVASATLTQSDETQANTNLYFPLVQDGTTEWLYHWQMRMGGSGTNRRAGLHIFASNPSLSQRGDSYLLWFRLDNQRIEIYEITGNNLPPPQYQISYPFAANTWYDIKALYSPSAGLIRIWINNQLVATYNPATILTSGAAVSLRTGNSLTSYQALRVYRSRGPTFSIEIGAGGHVRYESPSPTQPAGRLLSLVCDQVNLWSTVVGRDFKVDWTAPASSLTVSGWKTANFLQSFTDFDALSGIAYRFFLVDYENGGWQAQGSAGMLYDDFGSSQLGWSSYAGSWSVSGGTLSQSDVTATNTGYHKAVSQAARAFYRVQARLTNPTGNRRWGFHIFVDDPTLAQRGNSYLIWLRYDNQDLQLYETITNVLYLRASAPFTLAANADYLVEVLYDQGVITVWINGAWALRWVDDTPLTSGAYISLRTNQAAVQWDFVEVWAPRSATATITVGPTFMLASQNPNPATPAGRLHTLVIDSAANRAVPASVLVNVDWTPPTAPFAVRDGLGPDESLTTDGSALSGNWDPSTDPHSDVSLYQYAIGTAPGLADVVGWVSAGLVTSVTHSGLSLTPGQMYYFGVRAVNGAGLTGPESWSNGILYDPNPLTYQPPFSTDDPTKGLRLYPNPVLNELVLEIPDSLLPLNYILYDAQGRAVLAGTLHNSYERLDLSHLAVGSYWLTFPDLPSRYAIWRR